MNAETRNMSAPAAPGLSSPDAIPLHRHPTDLPRLLSGAVEVLKAQALSLDVALLLEAPRDLPPVQVDADKIAWAVTTLVGNALRHVRSGTRRLPGGTIRVRIVAATDSIVISVDDDGTGISPDKLDKLFERGGEVRHGVGLGLLMIRDVVAAHGGELRIESRCDPPDTGTRVIMRLPRDNI